jgi:hypothetical protein
VGPLLTSSWLQATPYEDKCPVYQGERCTVGCTAVAMAQIMRYWKHPTTGTGSHSCYWALGARTLSADFGSTTYNWAAMPTFATSSSPLVQKNALSTLCYHCGVSLDMNYSPDGSSAAMYGDRLTNYFGYLPTSTVWKFNYSEEGWLALMREQIDRGWPVWYAIVLSEGYHSVVVDGYDSPNLVRLNMGWGGIDDGFWSILSYPPTHAVIDIRPDRPTISRSPVSLSSSCLEGENAPQRSFEVWNSGSGTLSYSVGEQAAWLACSPTNGTSAGEHDTITLTFAASGLSPGTYSAVVTISAPAASNTPQTVSITLTVSEVPPPVVCLSTATVSASCAVGENAAQRTFDVWNCGGKTLSYSITDNAAWIACDPTSGTSSGEHDTITVTFATANLSIGGYSAVVTIAAPDATNSPEKLGVSLTVTEPPPVICLSATGISAWGAKGKNAPQQTFEVWNCGETTLAYSVSDDATWLSCAPTSGTSTGEHDTITANFASSALALGTYSATIVVRASGAANTPQKLSVTLTVGEPVPAICLSTASITACCAQGSSATPQSFQVWNCGEKALNYSIGDNASWLACDPMDGSSAGERHTITVSFASSGLPVGTRAASIVISAPGASNSPQRVSVTLTVNPPHPPLTITELERTPEGQPQITWGSRSGDTYLVWSSLDLRTGAWVQEATVASGGPSSTWTDTAPLPRAKFYRVELQE